MMRVSYSRAFLKKISRLPQRVIELAQAKEVVFKSSPFDPRLETHKLYGQDREIWAFSINRSYRIKFIFLKEGGVLFLEVGTHDIYK